MIYHSKSKNNPALGLVSVITAVILVTCVPAQGSLITFNFQSTFTYVDPLLAGSFSVGETISSSYTFESTTPDTYPFDSTLGYYPGAITALSFSTSGGYSSGPAASGLNYIHVLNDYYSLQDYYQVSGYLTGSPINGYVPYYFYMVFLDYPVPNALSSDALPLTPPDVSSFEYYGSPYNYSYFYFYNGYNYPSAESYNSISLAQASAPEPGSMFLLGSGLSALGIYMRRRRNKA
jgi:hypothetical protein